MKNNTSFAFDLKTTETSSPDQSQSEGSVFDKHESEGKGYCRKFKNSFEYGSGSIMRDADGNEYIDILAACGSLNFGHNDPDMSEALISPIMSNQLAASLDLHSSAKADFLESFVNLILKTRDMDHRIQFPSPTGTNASDLRSNSC